MERQEEFNMKISEIVKKYRVYEPENKPGMLAMNPSIQKTPEDWEFVKTHKPEILDFLREKSAQEKERLQKAREEELVWKKSIGLDKLEDIIAKWRKYKYEFDKAWEEGEGIYPGSPDITVEEVAAQYPIAAAYLKAESWSNAAHWKKATAGKTAMQKIRNGEDYQAAIKKMEKEFHDYCEEHIWD